MKYFVRNSEKVGTCYHEFYKGHWDEETFWKEDSSSYKLYYEASEWLNNEVFTEYDCFTILGI
jgi:hypothetical protein